MPMGSPIWTSWDSTRGIPTSWAIRLATSSIRAVNSRLTRVRSSVRSFTGVAAHPGNAARAAATARSTSSGDPSGTVPMTSSVVESITSRVPVPADGTHSPPMNKRSRTIYGCGLPTVVPLVEVASPQHSARGGRAPNSPDRRLAGELHKGPLYI